MPLEYNEHINLLKTTENGCSCGSSWTSGVGLVARVDQEADEKEPADRGTVRCEQ
jgi:hypothetical protein